MDEQQSHWELVMEIDERGRGLRRSEIEFIAAMIDGDRKGTLTADEMSRIRALHKRTVLRDDQDDEL